MLLASSTLGPEPIGVGLVFVCKCYWLTHSIQVFDTLTGTYSHEVLVRRSAARRNGSSRKAGNESGRRQCQDRGYG